MMIMMRHEMTMGTTWDDNYDGAMKWLRELHEMTNMMRHEMTTELHEMMTMMHHEITTGTTWDDEYDGAMKWLGELHEMTIMMAPWND